MRHVRTASLLMLLAVLTFVALPCGYAQSPQTKFKPGKWQIDSTITIQTGKQFHTHDMVCAKQGEDFWKHPHPNQQCGTPQVTPITNGYTVKLHCSGGNGPVQKNQWKMDSTISETFSANGTQFQSSGTVTTQTSIPGQAPIQATASMQAMGKRLGPCAPTPPATPKTKTTPKT